MPDFGCKKSEDQLFKELVPLVDAYFKDST